MTMTDKREESKMTFELQAWDLNSHFAGKTSQGRGAGSIPRDPNRKAPATDGQGSPSGPHSGEGITGGQQNKSQETLNS